MNLFGYSSKRPWKRVVESIALLLFIVFVIVALTNCSPDTNKTPVVGSKVTVDKKDADSETKKDKASLSAAKQANLALANKTPAGSKLKVHYIDVGQADSILIQAPGGKNMLIDAGNNDDANTIVTYLQSQGVRRLDIVIGTHPHEDHIGSMDKVINTFEIGQVVMPKKTTNTKTFKDVLQSVANKGLKITTAKSGLNLNLGPGISAQLLAPQGSSYEDLNNYSAVLKLVYGQNTFLFEGDAEDISEQEMLNSGYALKADVLKVGHHGSSSSTTTAFLSRVAPEYAVISVGRDNKYGHPTKRTLDKLAKSGVTVYRTDLNGTVVAESDGVQITFNK